MSDNNRALKSALGRVAGIAGLYRHTFGATMLIVTFHRVNDRMAPDGLTCSAAKFEAFCRFFRRHARVVPLAEQVAGCRDGRDMGGTISITFDDGYRDNYEVAAPILRSLQLPATFFVTSGFIGSQVVAPWDTDLTPPPPWMTWDNLRALRSQGFDIGAHTDTHIDMGSAALETVRQELEICRDKIRNELGIGTQLFAYPFGDPGNITADSRELVRSLGFTCCASCYGGVNPAGTDPFQLRRIPIAEWFTTPHQFGFEFIMGRALGRI